MSLNLISSLSLLKSRLEKTPVTPRVKTQVKAKAPVSRLDVRRLNSADMFGGITESDLDTSSSEDDDEDDSDSDSSHSGYASPKSGFNTPEVNQKDEPTQVNRGEEMYFLAPSGAQGVTCHNVCLCV